jgi:transposase
VSERACRYFVKDRTGLLSDNYFCLLAVTTNRGNLHLPDQLLGRGRRDGLADWFRRGGFAVLVKRAAKYEVIHDGEATIKTVPSPETLFPRARLHSSAITHVITSKLALGVPHYRLEQDLAHQGVPLDRGTMCRYVEHAGNVVGATIVHAMWQDALTNAQVISIDATGGLIQPAKTKDSRAQACKKGHFFTAVVDCDAICSRTRRTPARSCRTCSATSAITCRRTRAACTTSSSTVRRRTARTAAGLWDVRSSPEISIEAAICRYPAGLQGLLRVPGRSTPLIALCSARPRELRIDRLRRASRLPPFKTRTDEDPATRQILRGGSRQESTQGPGGVPAMHVPTPGPPLGPEWPQCRVTIARSGAGGVAEYWLAALVK